MRPTRNSRSRTESSKQARVTCCGESAVLAELKRQLQLSRASSASSLVHSSELRLDIIQFSSHASNSNNSDNGHTNRAFSRANPPDERVNLFSSCCSLPNTPKLELDSKPQKETAKRKRKRKTETTATNCWSPQNEPPLALPFQHLSKLF